MIKISLFILILFISSYSGGGGSINSALNSSTNETSEIPGDAENKLNQINNLLADLGL